MRSQTEDTTPEHTNTHPHHISSLKSVANPLLHVDHGELPSSKSSGDSQVTLFCGLTMNPTHGLILSTTCATLVMLATCSAQEIKPVSAASTLPTLSTQFAKLPSGPPFQIFQAINQRTQTDRNEKTISTELKKQRRLEELDALDNILTSVSSGSDYVTASKLRIATLAGLSRHGSPWKKQATDYAARMAGEDNESLARSGRFTLLALQTANFSSLKPAGQDRLVHSLYYFLNRYGADNQALALGDLIARAHSKHDRNKPAADIYRRLAIACTASTDPNITKRETALNASARRVGLLGRELSISGTTIDGKQLVWKKMRGNVVLIDFWASWCQPCIAELKNVKSAYAKYHANGFEVVGINLDTNRDSFKTSVDAQNLPWLNIGSPNDQQAGWQHPMAVHHGVVSLPTAILVDRNGKVVSINAHGKELDRLLKEMCNPVK